MQRRHFLERIHASFRVHPIVALLGPRQCGKTTLARMYIQAYSQESTLAHYFDLENPRDRARLLDPILNLSALSGLIVIDEIQRVPDLFPILRVLVDNQSLHQQFLILGSASRELIKQSSESLAGRLDYIEITPLSLYEVHEMRQLWLRGGFPPAYLAVSDEDSRTWRNAYVRTYLEQDIPNLGFNIPATQLERVWMMLAHYHGNVLNYSELGRSLDLNQGTIKKYLDILSGTFMIRQLQPWHENISKRQVKSPKLYFRDSGMLHHFFDFTKMSDLLIHPKLGASWEGFALEETIRKMQVRREQCYFWSTHSDAELDLLIIKGDKRYGFEFKYSDVPKVSKSMHIALKDLKLENITILYPGDVDYFLTPEIQVRSLENFSA